MPEGEKERTREDRVARSVAVERTYVHEVYDEIAPDLARSKDPLKATVHKFLEELEPGSLVADIGCGDGRYLSVNSSVHMIGTDRSGVQTQIAKNRQNECLRGDNLDLPFRSEVFDAVTSISVVHHLASSGRRVKALRELARILRVGGKILITVHALDHDSKICSRDVLLAWYQSPQCKVADDKYSSESGQHNDDDDEDCNDYDDSISLPSSDEEEEVFPLERIRPIRMISDVSHQASVFKTKPVQRTWRSLDASPRYDIPADQTRNSLEHPLPGYSCYSFVRKALRRLHSSDSSSRLSLQVSSSSQQRSYSTDSALPTSPDVFFKDNIPYDHQYYYADGDINHIELRNLDEDDEYPLALPRESNRSLCDVKDNVSAPVAGSKSKLVRSFSDFFKRIPKLWNNKISSSSCNDLPAKSILRDNSFHFGHIYMSNSQCNNIVRSQSTATCTFKFHELPHLEKVEELDYFVDLETVLESLDEHVGIIGRRFSQDVKEMNDHRSSTLTLLDIENGNVLPVTEEAGRNREKYETREPDSLGNTIIEEQNHNNELSKQVPNRDLSNSSVLTYQGTHNNPLADVNSHYPSLDEQEVTFSRLSVEAERHVKAVKRSIAEESEIDEVISKLKHLKVNDWTSSPKRHQDQQQVTHMVNSRTAGPFYDTDDEDNDDDEIILSSYYSMPELYKLSDFHDEYYVQKQQAPKKLFLNNVDCEVYSNYYNFVTQQNENVYRCEVTSIPDNENALYTNRNPSVLFDNVNVSSSNELLAETFFEKTTFPSTKNNDCERTVNILCGSKQHSESLEELKDFITQINKENNGGFAGQLKPKNLDFLEFSNSVNEELFQPSTTNGDTLSEQNHQALSCKPSFSQIRMKSKLNEDTSLVVLRDHHEKADESVTNCSSSLSNLQADLDNRNPSDNEMQKYLNTEKNVCMIANHSPVCATSSSTREDRKQFITSDSSLVRLVSRDCVHFTPKSSELNGSTSDGDLECLESSRSALSSPVERNQYSARDELTGNGQTSENFVSSNNCETKPNVYIERTNNRSREIINYSQRESPKSDDCLNTDNRLEEKEAYSCTNSFRIEESDTHDSNKAAGNRKGAHFSTDLSHHVDHKTVYSNLRCTEITQVNNLCNSMSHHPSSVNCTSKRSIQSDESAADCSRRELNILHSSRDHGHQENNDCSAFPGKIIEGIECSSESNGSDLQILGNEAQKKSSNCGKKPMAASVQIELQEKFKDRTGDYLLNQSGGGKFPLNTNYEIFDEIIPSFDVTASEYLNDSREKFTSGSMIKINDCSSMSCNFSKTSSHDKNVEITQDNKNVNKSSVTDCICPRSKCVFDQKHVNCFDMDNKQTEEVFDPASSENDRFKTPTSSLEGTKNNHTCGGELEISRNICTRCLSQGDITVEYSVSRNVDNINDLVSKETTESDVKTDSNSSCEMSLKERSLVVEPDSSKRNDIKTTNNEAYRNEKVLDSNVELTSQEIQKFPVVHESRNSQATLRSSAESSQQGKECNFNSCQSSNFKSQSISSETEVLLCRESSLILPSAREEFEDIVDHLYGQVGDEHSSLTTHRYYHLFEEGELQELIENYVQELHVLSISFQGSSWCIVAEKVRVWTI